MIEFILLFTLGILFLYVCLKPKSPKGRLIPGPKGLPLIGCAHEITAANLHNQFIKYALQYGDIVQFKVFGKSYVLLNSAEYIRKAFCDDPYKYYFSDRLEFFFGKYVLYGSQAISTTLDGFTQTHNEVRKGVTRGLHFYGEGVNDFEKTARSVVDELLESIEKHNGNEFDFSQEIAVAMSKIMAILLSGEPIAADADDTQIFADFNQTVNFLVNPKVNAILMAFPFLRRVPGPYRNGYQAVLNAKQKLVDKYFYKIKETYQPGKVRGIVDFLIQEQRNDMENGNKSLFTDERIMSLAMETASAGILTSWSTIGNMMLCLLHHPQYQTRMQQEIDDVIGRERPPTIEDRASCPFIEAVALESQRYITTTPVLLPHLCKPNISFEGYDIPENTPIFANVHYIHHDEKVWGDPWNFRPERFLDEDGQLLPRGHVLRKNWLPFGIGRRQCIGESLARSRIFLVMSSLLQRWNFVPSRDRCGPCDPRSDNIVHGVVLHSKPFFCHVEERN